MIRYLYDVKKEYKDKNIYIWDVNRSSLCVFWHCLERYLDIKGFVLHENPYAEKVYLNRPVLLLDEVLKDRNNIILVGDDIAEDDFPTRENGQIFYWKDVLEFNKELYTKKIVVYGTGVGADNVCKFLEEKNIEVDCFCVTSKKENKSIYRGKNVVEVSDLNEEDDWAIIISVIKQQYKSEIRELLYNTEFDVYLDEFLPDVRVMQTCIWQKINAAVMQKKQIYLYSEKKNQLTFWMEWVLKTLGVELQGYLYEQENDKQDIRSIYEVTLNGYEDKFVIICETRPDKYVRASDILEDLGYSLLKKDYTALVLHEYSPDYAMGNSFMTRDALVGYSMKYSSDEECWKRYGKNKDADCVIVTLGGSTSSEIYRPGNWVKELYNEFRKRKINVTIYNGAHTGDTVVQEFLRLLRDGYCLKPNIVISMSGVNDLMRRIGCVNQFNLESYESLSGLCSDESFYDFWVRTQKRMKLIAEQDGVAFYSFLQPININKPFKSLQEKSWYEFPTRKQGVKEFLERANDNDGYVNLLKLFWGQDDMYFDPAHYTEKANKVLADIVLQEIMPEIKKLNIEN